MLAGMGTVADGTMSVVMCKGNRVTPEEAGAGKAVEKQLLSAADPGRLCRVWGVLGASIASTLNGEGISPELPALGNPLISGTAEHYSGCTSESQLCGCSDRQVGTELVFRPKRMHRCVEFQLEGKAGLLYWWGEQLAV